MSTKKTVVIQKRVKKLLRFFFVLTELTKVHQLNWNYAKQAATLSTPPTTSKLISNQKLIHNPLVVFETVQ